jgi:hypothetical protein
MDAPGTEGSQSLKWYEVWREVYFHPSEQTFHRILADPLAKPGRAFLWVAILGVLSGIVQAFSTQGVDTGQIEQVSLFSLVICIPLGAVIALALSALIMHWIAGLFGGNGTYDRLVYAFGSIQAPATLVSVILSSIGTLVGLGSLGQGGTSPLLICLAPFSLAWSIYLLFLEVLALKAVEGLTTGKAILTLLLPLIVVLVLGGLCVALVLVPVIVRSVQ